MGNYLITGRSGTGKSTIHKELVSRGYASHDGDSVPQLAGWTDLSIGQRIESDYPGHDHFGKFDWDWDKLVLKELLSQPGETFLCGNADNAINFYGLFDKVFILTLPEAEQRRRIMARSEHDYGKDAAVQNEVIRAQTILVETAMTLGAMVVDAQPSAQIIVDYILEKISHDG